MRPIDADELKRYFAPNGMTRDYIDLQPTIKGLGVWTPCSERLPEVNEEVLITFYSDWDYKNEDPIIGMVTDLAEIGRVTYYKAVAWMPLPAPYEKEEEECEK